MKNIKYFIVILILSMSVSSCDEYLNRQEDQALSEATLFKKRNTTEQYLANVYGFIPTEWNASDEQPWLPASDEADFSFSRAYNNMNNGTWNPANASYSFWDHYYQGIREATYFMTKVETCPELDPDEALTYKAEARFLRAFYYFSLMRQYGPVLILGEDVVPIDGSVDLNRSRTPWEECVKWVSDELDACAAALPAVQPLQRTGLATSGMAKAVKSRLLLYSASQLYNPKPGTTSIYKNYPAIFSTQYDAQKWKAAADAAKAVIDHEGGMYKLYTSEDKDVYKSLLGIYQVRWNSELIFARSTDDSWFQKHAAPRGVTGYGGYGATQNQVDAFAMENGVYPIKGYVNGDALIENQKDILGYAETGLTSYTHPIDKVTSSTYLMYQKREPRFYINVVWNGMVYKQLNVNPNHIVQFYKGGTSGNIGTFDYCTTGYLIRKFSDVGNISPQNGTLRTGTTTWPMIRLAEIYLNYAEALCEYDYAGSKNEILTYMNKIRKRAGVPDLEVVYPEVLSSKDVMLDMIRRERRVELCFESLRYFDTRRWQIAEQTDGGNIYGMNVEATKETEATDYWHRRVLEKRVFLPKHYLFPITQSEIDRNKKIEQLLW